MCFSSKVFLALWASLRTIGEAVMFPSGISLGWPAWTIQDFQVEVSRLLNCWLSCKQSPHQFWYGCRRFSYVRCNTFTLAMNLSTLHATVGFSREEARYSPQWQLFLQICKPHRVHCQIVCISKRLQVGDYLDTTGDCPDWLLSSQIWKRFSSRQVYTQIHASRCSAHGIPPTCAFLHPFGS